jgi:uncharacterized protein (TIGR03437 family)
VLRPSRCQLAILLALSCVAAESAFAAQFTSAIVGPDPIAITAIATDAAGNTYLAGNTQPSGTPSRSYFVVAKFDGKGNLLFTNTIGGQGLNAASAIAVDPTGNIYVAGATTSPDFPLKNALQTQLYGGPAVSGQAATSAFIVKLGADGTTILYSTFFGGTLGQSAISSLAFDRSGNLYLTGYTQASDIPHTAGMPFGTISQSPTIPGAMIASISASGDRILYSGAIPMTPNCLQQGCSALHGIGSIQNEGVAIALDSLGNAYVAGNAGVAEDLPTTSGVLSKSGMGAFVVKINAGGAGIGYLTYLTAQSGVAPWNTLTALAVDADGNAYLGGQTSDPDFPATPGAYRPADPDRALTGFLGKLNPQGSAMVWASLFEIPQAIALDPSGNLWASGSPNLRLPDQNGTTTGTDYLAALNPSGSQLIYSSLHPAGTVGNVMAIDPLGLLHIGGLNGFVSTIAPFAAQEPQIFYFGNGAGSSATTQLAPGEVIAIYGQGIGPASPVVASPVDWVYPTALGGVEVTVSGMKMPVLYASDKQINAVVPIGLSKDAAATVRLTYGSTVLTFPVWIKRTAAMGFAAVLNEDGTLNSRANPAKSGSVVKFYATGWETDFTPLTDGEIARTLVDRCQGNCIGAGSTPNPSVRLPVRVLYGGDAPGYVAGISQFHVQIGAVPNGSSCFTLAVQGPVSAAGPGAAAMSGVCVAP